MSKSKASAPIKAVPALRYSVLCFTIEGLEIVEPIDAASGDEAAAKAQAMRPGASVRGVLPYEGK